MKTKKTKKYLIYEVTKEGNFLHVSTTSLNYYRAKLKRMIEQGREYRTVTKIN